MTVGTAQPGQILAAEQNGAYLIKLVGDVRLTLSTALDDYFDAMFANEKFKAVAIELCETSNIDSTSLGMLAKLAITARKRFGFTPLVISSNPSITRILHSMSFERVFDIREEPIDSCDKLVNLPQVDMTEEESREQVLEAHKVLMGLSDENKARFKKLVAMLE